MDMLTGIYLFVLWVIFTYLWVYGLDLYSLIMKDSAEFMEEISNIRLHMRKLASKTEKINWKEEGF